MDVIRGNRVCFKHFQHWEVADLPKIPGKLIFSWRKIHHPRHDIRSFEKLKKKLLFLYNKLKLAKIGEENILPENDLVRVFSMRE